VLSYLGEIGNKFDGFHYLLEVNDVCEAHDHEADLSDFEGTNLSQTWRGYSHHRRQGPCW
jgi:hypothetical protein